MFDLRLLDNTAWLCDPKWTRHAISRLTAIPHCPTARELVEARQRRCEVARNAAVAAVRGVKGKIGVIPIYGLIQQRVTAEMEKLGGTSIEEISLALDALMRDKSVDVIVYDIDSPGGASYGVEELSDKMFAARERKRSYAISNSLMASAAYWLGSAASHVSASPSSDTGSIGVYAVHIDESRAMEAEGLTVTMVTAGKYKAEYASTRPLSDDARERLQSEVGFTYEQFLNGVKRNRGTTLDNVRRNYGQGRTLNAYEAKEAGMVDRVASFDEIMAGLMGPAADSNGTRSTMELLRLQHQQRMRASSWHE